ncbi:MAG: zinc metalloprotease, partial [Actinobacteria bacterium 13_2_20CM_2_71_6]
MAYLLGVILFALAIFISVCLHEAGHMVTAKAFGMKVTRYFAGFGPTLWSFKRGETEYGLKGIPLGGFVKIVGMTPQDDDVAPADQPRAMWRYPLWKRTVVMSAGSVTHFLLGFVVLWILFVFVGVPNPAADPTKQRAMISLAQCVYANDDEATCAPTDPASPAKLAGLRDGDVITALDGKPIKTYEDLQKAIRSGKFGPVDVTYQRDGQTQTTVVSLVPATRHPLPGADGKQDPSQSTVPALGVTYEVPPEIPLTVTYGPVEALGQGTRYTGQVFGAMGSAIGRIPQKVPALWNSLSGKPRDPNTPISVA